MSGKLFCSGLTHGDQKQVSFCLSYYVLVESAPTRPCSHQHLLQLASQTSLVQSLLTLLLILARLSVHIYASNLLLSSFVFSCSTTSFAQSLCGFSRSLATPYSQHKHRLRLRALRSIVLSVKQSVILSNQSRQSAQQHLFARRTCTSRHRRRLLNKWNSSVCHLLNDERGRGLTRFVQHSNDDGNG